MKYKIGIIGIGVMGKAILDGILQKNLLNPNEIALFDVSSEKLAEYNKSSFGIFNNANELINNSEYVLLSIKPQQSLDLFNVVKFNDYNVLISIMAGVRIETLKKRANANISISRIMPNTPCKIGQGISAICYENCTKEHKDFIKSLFATCGAIIEVEEKYFDAITSISGSGPAYVYMFIDGMIKGGIQGGLSYEESKKLAINTVIGASALALQSDESLETLTDMVCSKGGTTIEAVKIYKNEGLQSLIIKGIEACRNRSKELSKQ